jgi:hypothetical protein
MQFIKQHVFPRCTYALTPLRMNEVMILFKYQVIINIMDMLNGSFSSEGTYMCNLVIY